MQNMHYIKNIGDVTQWIFTGGLTNSGNKFENIRTISAQSEVEDNLVKPTP